MTKQNREEAIADLRLYKLSEVAAIMGVTHRTVWNYVKAGKIPARKIAGTWRITEGNLREYLNGSDNGK